MAAQKKTKAKKGPRTDITAESADALSASNEPVLCLARLIGRQIAREQFEQHDFRKRKLHRQKSSKST
ncbi:hypothetical protein [Roseitalea porphyridii]